MEATAQTEVDGDKWPVTCARAHPIQDRRTDVQGSARHSTTVPWTIRPCSRSVRLAGTPLCQLQSPGGADVPTVYSRQSDLQRFSGPRIWNGLPEDGFGTDIFKFPALT